MPYGLIVIAAVIALTVHYVFCTGASLIPKVLVIGVLGVCLAFIYWLHRFSLAALLLMVALGIYISFYRIYAQARSSNRRD